MWCCGGLFFYLLGFWCFFFVGVEVGFEDIEDGDSGIEGVEGVGLEEGSSLGFGFVFDIDILSLLSLCMVVLDL